MAEKTEISWTDATFNPWWGCAKVSPACDHCYAERDSKRYQPGKTLWGVDAERREFGDKHWAAPVAWNARAAREGKRLRVFCASMADVFDKNAPAGARARLFQLINETPHLDWLLLTKRIGNVASMAKAAMVEGLLDTVQGPLRLPPNVRIGITVINQEEVDRDVPKLLALHVPNFLSIEPMLGKINLDAFLWTCCGNTQAGAEYMGQTEEVCCGNPERADQLDWVIAGGESGPGAREARPDWIRSLRDQCSAAGVPFHFKQWGEWGPVQDHEAFARGNGIGGRLTLSGSFAEDDNSVQKVGKKAAGWLLDGVEHKAFPI